MRIAALFDNRVGGAAVWGYSGLMTQRAVEILEEVRQLSRDDRIWLLDQLRLDSAGQSPGVFSEVHRQQIDAVLRERVDGPFRPLDEGLAERVKRRGVEQLF